MVEANINFLFQPVSPSFPPTFCVFGLKFKLARLLTLNKSEIIK
jgi:hypothetical protein